MRNTKTVLIVGGDIRRPQLEKLAQGLAPLAVEWISTRETDAGPSRFQPSLLRPEICLVVILTGLIRHQHLADLLRLCRRRGLRRVLLRRSPALERIRMAVA